MGPLNVELIHEANLLHSCSCFPLAPVADLLQGLCVCRPSLLKLLLLASGAGCCFSIAQAIE